MGWKEKLQPASFRGVPFLVESDAGAFGRRVKLNEYLYRDKPYVEDLGRAARKVSITGFLLGDDYLEQRDRLLVALEAAGPGTLVHPWYGQMQVSLDEPGRVSHSREHGGMCTLQLSFVESGELIFPDAADSHGTQTLAAADKLQSVSTDDFAKKFSVDGLPSFVLDDAAKVFSENLDLVHGGVSGFGKLLANPLDVLRSQGAELLPDAFAAGATVFGLFNRSESIVESIGNIFGGGGSSARNRDAVQALVGMSDTFNERASVATPVGISPNRRQIAENAAALNTLFSNAMLVQAAGMTAAMDLPVYDDAVTIRTSVTGALDRQSLSASDEVYRATQDLRTSVYRDVTARLSGSARLNTITPRRGMSALVIAYDRYEDVSREGEIVGINGLRRPGFLSTDPIKVLSA